LEYASKIRQLRQLAKVTQPQLAESLNVKRGAVANWEGGVREPRRENYLALAASADAQAALHREEGSQSVAEQFYSLADFFLSQIEDKKAQREKRQKEAYARHYVNLTRSKAAGGNRLAQELLELSDVDGIEFAKRQADRIAEARERLSNGAFRAKLLEISGDIYDVGMLRLGRRSLAEQRIKGLLREFETLLDGELRIVAKARAAHTALLKGNMAKVWEILKQVPESHASSRRRLEHLRKILDVHGRDLDAQKKGKPLEPKELETLIDDALNKPEAEGEQKS
jgi:transcriptional regulator with XRE-family HTH domain